MPRIQKRLGVSIRASEVGVGFSKPSFTNASSVGAGLEARITSGISTSLNNGVVVMVVTIVAVVPAVTVVPFLVKVPVVTVVPVVEVVSVVAVVPTVAVVLVMAII